MFDPKQELQDVKETVRAKFIEAMLQHPKTLFLAVFLIAFVAGFALGANFAQPAAQVHASAASGGDYVPFVPHGWKAAG